MSHFVGLVSQPRARRHKHTNGNHWLCFVIFPPEFLAYDRRVPATRLSQHGQELYLPLSALLLDEDGDQPSNSSSINDGGDRRLCVTREAVIRQVSRRVKHLQLHAGCRIELHRIV